MESTIGFSLIGNSSNTRYISTILYPSLWPILLLVLIFYWQIILIVTPPHTHTQLHPLPMILSLVHMQLCMDHWCLHARNHNKNQVTGFWAAGSAEPWPFVLPLLYLHSYLAVGLLFVGQLGVRRRFRSRPPRSCHSPFLQSGHETTEASVGEGHKAWIEGWINQAHKSQYVFLPDFP